MKKLFLLWIAGTITLTAPVLPMAMDTSDDTPSSSSAFAPGAYASAMPAPAGQKKGDPRGIPNPIRKIMSEEYGMASDSVEGMAKIISAMNAQEKEELFRAAHARTSSDSDDSDNDDIDIDASDAELTFIANMIVNGTAKRKHKSHIHHPKKSRGKQLLASCTECDSCIRAIRDQKLIRSRMEDRCRNFPDCLVFTPEALESYILCQERRKDGKTCQWLLTKEDNKGQHKTHLKTHHPERYAAQFSKIKQGTR